MSLLWNVYKDKHVNMKYLNFILLIFYFVIIMHVCAYMQVPLEMELQVVVSYLI